jgi:hypothetical protein
MRDWSQRLWDASSQHKMEVNGELYAVADLSARIEYTDTQ